MYKGQTVGVVIPAYNEAGFVGEVIATVPAFVDRIYAVDDASTDDTWAEITERAQYVNNRQREAALATADGGVSYRQRVVTARHEQNRGVGATIKTGYRLAVEDGIDVVAVMNADGQMDPDILDRIVDPVAEGRAAYAKGNRLERPAYRAAMSRWRLFGNAILTLLTKIASGYWGMMDPQNGYTAVSREALETIDLDAVYDRFGFCNDMLVHMNVHRFRIVDVDMPAVYGEETSHIEYSSFVPQLSFLLARQFLWRLRVRHLDDGVHPLAACYGFGATAILAGFGHGVRSLWNAGEGGRTATYGLLFGVVMFVLAVLFDSRDNADLEVEE
ncbi:MAG: glycosyltransferase [Halapricum sp.]